MTENFYLFAFVMLLLVVFGQGKIKAYSFLAFMVSLAIIFFPMWKDFQSTNNKTKITIDNSGNVILDDGKNKITIPPTFPK